MIKILILNDLHFGESRNSTTHKNVIRQANTQAKVTLEKLLPYFQSLNIDFVFELGDTLRDTFDAQVDTQNILDAVSLVEQIKKPTIHVLGNHELLALPKSQLKTLYYQAGSQSPFFGYKEIDALNVIWLDLELDEHKLAYLSDEQLNFIKSCNRNNNPTIVFSHYSLVPINQKGSFYFENSPEGMYYKNYAQAHDAFSAMNVKLFINAHVHLLSHQVRNEQHYISSPAFSENIAAQNYTENNPGVYSILEINPSNFIFTSYSGEFCFSKIEGKLS